MKDATIGNQQERLYSWFGGIVDGEGSIFASKITCSSKRYPQYKTDKVHIRLGLKIEMADERTINRCIEILRDLGVTALMSTKTRRAHYVRSYYSVKVAAQTQLKHLLPILIPYLFTKRQQAETMLQYLTEREKGSFTYTPYELKLVEKMRSLNKLSSETTR
jgi:hypothetical protein